MYESPITLMVENVEKQLRQEKEQAEQTIYQCVNSFGVVVDKDELFKALKYDRDQYSKGYKDGVNEVLEKIKAEISKYEPVNPNVMCPIEFHKGALEMQLRVLEIIDRYKTESEV